MVGIGAKLIWPLPASAVDFKKFKAVALKIGHWLVTYMWMQQGREQFILKGKKIVENNPRILYDKHKHQHLPLLHEYIWGLK